MQNPSDPAGQLDLDSGIELQDDLEGDTLREECGVFGIFGHPEAAAITALGLHALQHRGQEAAGIVSFDGSRFHSERRLGLVGDTFSRRDVIDRLPGKDSAGGIDPGVADHRSWVEDPSFGAADAGLGQQLARQIEAAHGRILVEITQNVRELQRMAEAMRQLSA